jgi:hypothetical protein
MCGLLISFTGATVVTVWGLDITNRMLMRNQICMHQHQFGRVRDLMFFFRCTQYLTVLNTAILSAVVVFYCQMQLPHCRLFLLTTWVLSALICLLCHGVVSNFLILEGTGSCEDEHGDEENYDEEEIPPQKK